MLSPTSPLFREARYLLADEPELHDLGLYQSVLAAIAAGNTQRGGIASYLGRRSGDLAATARREPGSCSTAPPVSATA